MYRHLESHLPAHRDGHLVTRQVIGSEPPALLISIPLEGTPHVSMAALHETDEIRLLDWINAHGDLRALVNAATAAREARRAA